MDYENTVSELFDLQKYAIKLGLDNINAIMHFLNNPHKDYPVIHIAGTNGKGSTAFFLAGILQSMGLKTGLFTSPHLVDFRERIRVNGNLIAESDVINFWQRVREVVLERKATFFDTTTAMGLDYFSREKVDVAIIETGLGGRLDSTNIVDSEIAVITPIDYDHQKQLGTALFEIASEKAGIIKENSIVVCAEQDENALLSLQRPKNKSFYFFPDFIQIYLNSASIDSINFNIEDKFFKDSFPNLISRQAGNYQAENIGLAYFVTRLFLKSHKKIFNKSAFRDILKKLFWIGRLQTVSTNPRIIFDVSHNPGGIKTTLEYLSSKIKKDNLHVILGLVEDKSHEKIVSVIAKSCRTIYLTEPETDRRLDGKELLRSFKKIGKETILIKNPQEVFAYAKEKLDKNDTLLVIGSHYLIGILMAKQ
jgi:dihydrofolate synthase/folylpolyglutamate synthase